VPLLRQAVATGIQAPLALSLLDHLAGPESDQRAFAPRPDRLGPKAHWVEPLTERELEVLRLIADGLSNLDIAGRLVITVGTVKAHTSSIYGKLGVNTRTRAVARAQSLGLL
jgi:LuxR family maltose regulon positive regulatory protein